MRVQIEPSSEDGSYPGRIAEGRFWIEYDLVPKGYLNVEDMAGDFVGGRMLQAGEDAAMVARQILRKKLRGSIAGLSGFIFCAVCVH